MDAPSLFGAQPNSPTAQEPPIPNVEEKDPYATGYESTLPDDIQYSIMQHFVVQDPSTALRLASSSHRQAAMLETFRDRLVGADSVLRQRANSSSTAGDHVRASLALARHSDDVGRRATLAGVARCLMEAFARLLLDGSDSVYERLPGAPNVAQVVDRVGTDPRLGGALGRVAAWYAWITAAYNDPFAGQPPDPISWLIDTDPDLAGHGGGGHFDMDAVDMWRQSMRDDSDAVIAIGSQEEPTAVDDKQGGQFRGDNDNADVGDNDIDSVVPLWVFHGADGARRLAVLFGNSVAPSDLMAWQRRNDDGRIRAVLESANAEARLIGNINNAVAARLAGPCADPSGTGRLTLPPFTWLFDMRFFLVAAPDAMVLMASLWSPIIERDLLA
nr:hypothetical protein [Pandoravirus massiliensis]